MALFVKPLSFSHAATPVTGVTSVNFDDSGDFVEDASDGHLYTNESGLATIRKTITANFIYGSSLTGFELGDVGAIIAVLKDGKAAGTNATATAAITKVTAKSINADGSGGSLTFEATSSDGSTDPIVWS